MQDHSCLVLPCPVLSRLTVHPSPRAPINHTNAATTSHCGLALPLCAYWAPPLNTSPLHPHSLPLSLIPFTDLSLLLRYATSLAGVSIDGYLIPVEQNGIDLSNNSLKVTQSSAHMLLSSSHLFAIARFILNLSSIMNFT